MAALENGSMVQNQGAHKLTQKQLDKLKWWKKDVTIMPDHVKDLKAERIALKWEVNTRYAVVVKNVLTKEECQSFIDLTTELGYDDALINIGGNVQRKDDSFRKSKRCMIDSFEMTEHLFYRIEKFLPKYFKNSYRNSHIRKCLGLNERFRILKYKDEGYFRPHYDGVYFRNNDYSNDRSMITLLLYLNDGEKDFKGGTTNFLNSSNMIDYEKQEYEKFPIAISAGMVLLFEHKMFHEGADVFGGTKYCVRTDVMYSKETWNKDKEVNTKDFYQKYVQSIGESIYQQPQKNKNGENKKDEKNPENNKKNNDNEEKESDKDDKKQDK